MEQEILPIGSICTLKNDDKKILIVGLYSVVYDQDVIVYDYQGCSYPEGISLSDRIYSFNHADIDKIIHVGYADEEFRRLRHKLMYDNAEYVEEDVNYIDDEIQNNENESDIEVLIVE